MIRFELKKILMKKIVLIGIVALFILNVLFVISTCNSMYAFDGKSNQGTGIMAIKIDKEIAKKYEGILTDEKVQKMLQDFKLTIDLHGLNASYSYQNAIQSSVYARFVDLNGNWNGLTVKNVFGDKKINVGYVNGWLHVSQYMIQIFLILSLLIIVMVSPVFSGEYSEVGKLLLTTKYGKTKCSNAKNIAAILAVFFLTTFFAAINIIIALIIYGYDGLNSSIIFAPISFVTNYIPFNITCLTLIKYQILLLFTCVFSITGITLFLSSICKNQITTLIVSMSIFMLPCILPINESSWLYKFIVLMPVYQIQFVSIMSVEQMENGILYAIWVLPISIIIIVAGYIISRIIFANYQI